MTILTREELIELGLSISSRRLTEWAREQCALGAGKEERLRKRGVNGVFLAEVASLMETTQKRTPSGILEGNAEVLATVDRTRKEAILLWEEIKQIAKIEFGTQPDLLAQFRSGVRTGPTLSRIARELEGQLRLIREHSRELVWLGADDRFLARGDAMLAALREAQGRLNAALHSLTAGDLELCELKGRLYDLVRKLVRIGRLEFMREPEEAAAFNYDTLRRDHPVYAPIRRKTERSSARSG